MIETGVEYLVKGESVIFDLNGQDFTFKKFNVSVTDDSMKLIVKDEGPMVFIHLLDTVGDPVGVDRKQLQVAESVRFNLILKPDVFEALRTKILSAKDIRDVFEFETREGVPLRSFMNYEFEMYGITSLIECD